jgi:hypothetical protein
MGKTEQKTRDDVESLAFYYYLTYYSYVERCHIGKRR